MTQLAIQIQTSYADPIVLGAYDDDRRMSATNFYIELPFPRTVLTPAEALTLASELLGLVRGQLEASQP